MSQPLALLPWIDPIFYLADGTTPNALGTLEFYQAGTSTPQAVYSESDGSVSLGAVLSLNSNGRYATNIYLGGTGYKVIEKDSDGVPIRTVDDVESMGAGGLDTLGSQWSQGAKNQTSYTATNADNLITMNAGTLFLQPSADRTGLPLIVINVAATDSCAITPNGGETLNAIAGVYMLGVLTTPEFGWIMLFPTTSGYYMIGGHL